MSYQFRITVFLVLLAILIPGCGTDGTFAYALWDRYTHPEGRYSFYYLSPPWGQHNSSTGEHPVMVVDNFSETTSGGLGSRMRLEAWYDTENTALESALDRMNYWHLENYDVRGVDECESYTGDEGYAIEARFDLDRVREVFFEHGQGSVAFSVWYHGKNSTEDIDMLLEGFSPGNSGSGNE